jgi:hypothetical protein
MVQTVHYVEMTRSHARLAAGSSQDMVKSVRHDRAGPYRGGFTNNRDDERIAYCSLEEWEPWEQLEQSVVEIDASLTSSLPYNTYLECQTCIPPEF